jgi:hypothetical protein
MATKAKRPKAKSRAHSRAKRKTRSVPLTAGTAAVRKSKSAAHKLEPGRGAAAANPLDLAVAMFAFMQRATFTYAEFPARLVQCRSLRDVWREQARFARRIFSGTSI